MPQQNKIPLLAVVGPTASGKTALAVALAKRYGGEVISADSMQIYKQMHIATAKPTSEEMDGVPHHLMGFVPPDALYSVADYARDARVCIADVFRRGALPIAAGGTGLYLDALIRNIQYASISSDPALRQRLEERADVQGTSLLLEELRQVDPATAERLHPHDRKRIIRALEVYQAGGITLSEHNRRSIMQESPYTPFLLGLQVRDRTVLYERINRRVDEMVRQGLVEEAEEFFASGNSKTSAQAIGYKELLPYFRGEEGLEQALENIRRETRRYAKRQLSWFRRNPSIHWFYLDDYSSAGEMNRQIFSLLEKRCDFIGRYKKEKEN